MAAGCIPVASDLPGVREVLGRAGFTFPVGSAVELAHVLRTLRDDPAAVETFGIMARERAAEFTWERTIAEYERLLLDLVETRALSSAVTGSLGTVGQRGDNPLHTFVQHIARNLGTERAEVLLDGPMGGGALHGIASSPCPEAPHDATVPLPPDDPCGDSVMGSIVALARYSYDTGEGVLLAPRPLPHQQDGAKSALCIAPVVVDRKAIGALVALRLHPFEQRDLDSLSRLARHVAPILHSLDASGNALWPSDALLSNQMSPTSQTNVHAPLETASPSSAPPPPSLPRKS